MSRRTDNRGRIGFLQLSMLSMFAAAGFTQARLQLVQGKDIVQRAKDSKRFIVERVDRSHRGEIVSADGQPLAAAEGTRFMVLDYKGVKDSPGFFLDLAAASGVPATETRAQVGSKKILEWPLKSGAQADAVSKVKSKWRVDGLGVRKSEKRIYPMGALAAGVVGTMQGSDPLCGVELSQNALLNGRDGKQKGVVDRDGQYISVQDKESKKRVDGQRIELTIRADMQRKAYEALRDAVVGNRADQGAAVVLNPKTGDILAMASYPSFDPNEPIPATKPGQRSPAFSASYQAALEPGSTFKILTLAKAIDEGVTRTDTVMVCPGQIMVSGKPVRCDDHDGHRAHGALNPTEAIARSCNIAAANWAMKIGYQDFIPYLEDLGLMRRPDIGLPREGRGLFNYSEYAKTLQLANLGFGQSINVSPVSLASAFAMLANEGRTVRPRLIKSVGGRDLPAAQGEQVIRPTTAAWMLNAMRSVIDSEHGTGRGLRIPGFEIGGKTGTAQKRNSTTGTMEKGGYVSNFVGFVPARDPQAVILVMIDNPKAGKFYGAQVAGPVFLNIAKTAIASLGLSKSPTSVSRPAVDVRSSMPSSSQTREASRTPVSAAAAPVQNGPILTVRSRKVEPWSEDREPRIIGPAPARPKVAPRPATSRVATRASSSSKSSTAADWADMMMAVPTRTTKKSVVSSSGSSAIAVRTSKKADLKKGVKTASVPKLADSKAKDSKSKAPKSKDLKPKVASDKTRVAAVAKPKDSRVAAPTKKPAARATVASKSATAKSKAPQPSAKSKPATRVAAKTSSARTKTPVQRKPSTSKLLARLDAPSTRPTASPSRTTAKNVTLKPRMTRGKEVGKRKP